MTARVLLIGALLVQHLMLPGVVAGGSAGCVRREAAASTCCAAQPAACECSPAACGCDGREEPVPAAPVQRDRRAEQFFMPATLPSGACLTPPTVEHGSVGAARAWIRSCGGARHQAVLCIWTT